MYRIWLLMQGTKVQNKCARKEVAKSWLDVTLFGSRGTSSANSLSSGSSSVSIPRFARFREDSNLGYVLLFHTQRDSVRAQALPGHVSRLSSQDKKTKSEPGRRTHHDSPPPEQQEFASLQTASFANPAVRTELLSSTNVCGQLRHRRLPLLESLLQI